MVRFQHDLIDQIGQHRSRGVIIDVAALDVIDSFGHRTLRNIAEMARLRGAQTVIVGIQPDVAFAMVELGMDTGTVDTALDLEEGLHYLERAAGPPCPPQRLRGTLAVTELERLQRNYRTAFLRYLPRRDEAALHLGYEIGRAAMAGGLSLLDLAQVHHRILIEVLRTAPDQDVDTLVAAASDFLLEVLAAYELARRSFLQGSTDESVDQGSTDEPVD